MAAEDEIENLEIEVKSNNEENENLKTVTSTTTEPSITENEAEEKDLKETSIATTTTTVLNEKAEAGGNNDNNVEETIFEKRCPEQFKELIISKPIVLDQNTRTMSRKYSRNRVPAKYNELSPRADILKKFNFQSTTRTVQV